jgi:fatty-acyl-CoA synthase
LIREHKVTYFGGAPIVHNLLLNAPTELWEGITHKVKAYIAGAAPPLATLEAMECRGVELTHVYGLTETYGPATFCMRQEEWRALTPREAAERLGRQGNRFVTAEGVKVLHSETLEPVPWDGCTLGEVMFRGNMTMKGYLKDPKATSEAFAGGWFHSGDLAVVERDGYIKVKDRKKDIIISGGENISSLEVEDMLYRHPAVLAAAVVPQLDPLWGESPCAFVELRANMEASADELIAHCRANLAHYKVPRTVVFGPLPKTATGKIQKYLLRQRTRDGAIE